MAAVECMICGKIVNGWHEWRWESQYNGPVCRKCWPNNITYPGYDPEQGGSEYPEEAQPGFQIMRMRMIQNWRK